MPHSKQERHGKWPQAFQLGNFGPRASEILEQIYYSPNRRRGVPIG